MADTLKRLEYFACLAEIEHYSKAAEKIGIAQSALSQQIKALEAEVGVRLFEPAGRGIRLSAAGKDYHLSVIDLLDRHARAIEKARRTARGEVGQITVSHAGTALMDTQFLGILKNLRQTYTSVDIKLIEISMSQQLALLSSGKVDLAVIRGPIPTLPVGAVSRIFSIHRLFVAMSAEHPLAAKSLLSMKELEHESLVAYQEPDNEGITCSLINLARNAGFEPRIDWRVSAVNSGLGLVNARMALSLVPETVSPYAMGDIVFRPLSDSNASSTLFLVWMHDQTSPLHQRVIKLFLDNKKY